MKNLKTYAISSLFFFIITLATSKNIGDLTNFRTEYYFSLILPFLLYLCFYACTFVFFLKNRVLRVLFPAFLLGIMGVMKYEGFFICAPNVLFLSAQKETLDANSEQKKNTVPLRNGNTALLLQFGSAATLLCGVILFLIKCRSARLGIWEFKDFLPLLIVFIVIALNDFPAFENSNKKKGFKQNKKTAKRPFFDKLESRFFCDIYTIIMMVQSFLTITVCSSLKILFWQWLFTCLLIMPQSSVIKESQGQSRIHFFPCNKSSIS